MTIEKVLEKILEQLEQLNGKFVNVSAPPAAVIPAPKAEVVPPATQVPATAVNTEHTGAPQISRDQLGAAFTVLAKEDFATAKKIITDAGYDQLANVPATLYVEMAAKVALATEALADAKAKALTPAESLL